MATFRGWGPLLGTAGTPTSTRSGFIFSTRRRNDLFALRYMPDYEQRNGGGDCLCSADVASGKEPGVFASSVIDFVLRDH